MRSETSSQENKKPVVGVSTLPRSLSQDSKLNKHNDDDSDNGDDEDGEGDREEEQKEEQKQKQQNDYERLNLGRRLSGEQTLGSSQSRTRAQSCKHDGFDCQTGERNFKHNNLKKSSESSNLEEERYNLSKLLVRKQQQQHNSIIR